MDRAVVIPCRIGSKGVPRKGLVDVCGKPLIAWTVAQAVAADVGPIYVTTDSVDIVDAAREACPDIIPIHEPPRDGTLTLEEIVKFALPEIDSPEWIMVLQPTSPLRLALHIQGAFNKLADGDCDSLFSAIESKVFLWRNAPESAHGVNHDEHRRRMRQELCPEYAENGSIYLMRTKMMLAEGTRFCGRTVPYLMPGWCATEVDGPEDLDLVRLILADRLRRGSNGVTS